MKDTFSADFFFIRHGQTARNVNRDLIGQSPEEPLNDLGLAQAAALKTRFDKEGQKFDLIYCSPYLRAIDTMNIACQSIKDAATVHMVSALREINQGDGIDKSRKEIYTPEFLEHLDVMGMGFKFDNGESLYEVQHRAAKWLEHEILENPFMPVNKKLSIAVFTHGMTIKCLLHAIMDFDQRFTWKIDIGNTSITKLSFKDGAWFLRSVNDCAHLIKEIP